MDFAIRRRTLPPLMAQISRHFFYPTFFPLQLNPTLYLKRKHLVPVKNITIFPFDYLNPSLITNKKKLLVELHRLLYIVNLLQQACPLSQIRSDHIKLCNRILHSQKTNFKTDIFMKMSSNWPPTPHIPSALMVTLFTNPQSIGQIWFFDALASH